MQKATLLHNPKAGSESYTKNELISLIEKEGIECIYSSVKDEGWDNIDSTSDFIIVAGGDGTVRKVVKKLWKKAEQDKYPIALLPLGTANNIAKTLDIPGTEREIIKRWKNNKVRVMDAGNVSGMEEPHIFLESFGLGIFPVLMQEMKDEDTDTPEEKLNRALEKLVELIDTYEPPYFELRIDGRDYADNYYLVEIMNTQSVGPNLLFSPDANTADGEFEVIMITRSEKEEFRRYAEEKLQGIETESSFRRVKGKNITIKSEDYDAHADDEGIKVKNRPEVQIEVMPRFLRFLV